MQKKGGVYNAGITGLLGCASLPLLLLVVKNANILKELNFMQNTLGDLNNHLFAQIERLGDEDIKGEALLEEIARAKAINSVASQIIANGSLVLEAKKIIGDNIDLNAKLPKMLEA